MLGIPTLAVCNCTSAMKILNSQADECLTFEVSDIGYATWPAIQCQVRQNE